MADSIAVGTPRNWRRALAWVRASRGSMVSVPDAAILEAMRETARLGGGVRRTGRGRGGRGPARGRLPKASCPADATALAVITGNGLKDIRAAMSAAGHPHDVRPDLAAVADIVER